MFHQKEYRPPHDSILFDEDEDQLFSFQKALCGPLLLKEAEEAEEIQPNETFKLAVNKHNLHAFIQPSSLSYTGCLKKTSFSGFIQIRSSFQWGSFKC